MARVVISQREFESVIALGAEARYKYFVKRVADSQTAWSLWDGEKWVVYASSEGRQFFPLWPAKEYGDACAKSVSENAASHPIKVDRLIDEFLPAMVSDGVLPTIFPIPTGEGIEIAVDVLQSDLERELLKY